jgi:hypothetical protein
VVWRITHRCIHWRALFPISGGMEPESRLSFRWLQIKHHQY